VSGCRYEELKHQLEVAQANAHQEDEEQELKRATAAVARLTAPAPTSQLDVRLAQSLTDKATSNGAEGSKRSQKVRTEGGGHYSVSGSAYGTILIAEMCLLKGLLLR